jgi:pyridinium-3,5-biscarboxylic acid mononucleotide sulfurtransferase
LTNKLIDLESLLQNMGSVLVAYSGGVDSTFLAVVANWSLGDRALAVTASSPLYPETEVRSAQDIAHIFGLRHLIIKTQELDNPLFTTNSPDRCYYCKQELFHNLQKIAAKEGLRWVVDGSNHDDLSDHRPGRRAAAELGVRSPLCEVGLTKDDIRNLSREMNLPTWGKPSLACLASRLPYGTEVTLDVLSRIGQAEEYLRGLGVHQVRVRHHGETARIEVDPNSMAILVVRRHEVVAQLQKLGYTYISLDLQGYRSGSLNEILRSNS